MSFSSIQFIFYVLPAFLVFYRLVPGKMKYPLLLGASCLIYLWGSPTGAAILIPATLADFFLGRAIHGAGTQGRKKFILGVSVTLNILILIYFKYTNFFVGEVNRLLSFLGADAIAWTAVIFPVGISFITFHKISYLVDIYYGKVKPAESLAAYALYLVMFPKIALGPIVLYHEMEDQLSRPRIIPEEVLGGGIRFCVGLARKVLLADPMGAVADQVFRMDFHSMTVGFAWIGIVCYSFQLYLDFAGYTDMAIGIGRMMGIRIPENFNRPFYSQSFTEHWKRWHITLGNFFREYLYIPLGGNRASKFITYRNLWIVFIISGLWHGANWTYIVWGIYNGFFMFLDRLFLLKILKRFPKFITIAFFYVGLLVGYVFFRSETIGGAARYIHRMFDVTAIGVIEPNILLAQLVGNREWTVIAISLLICFFPDTLYERMKSAASLKIPPRAITALKVGGAVLLFILSVISIINNSFSPFIYFRF